MATTPATDQSPTPLAVGAVLRVGDPEPPDDTLLLDRGGTVEPYASSAVAGRWAEYVAQLGPFVVAPDWQVAVDTDTEARAAGGAR